MSARHLATAKRHLREHMETRPATPEEASAIAAKYRESAIALRQEAADLRAVPAWTASDIEYRGQHEEGRAANDRCKRALDLDQRAAAEDLHADAWERVAAGPEGGAWGETLRVLQGRVERYETEVRS